MYPLDLSGRERRLFTRALRGGDDDMGLDPEVPPEEPEDEGDDDPKGGDTPTAPAVVADQSIVTANIAHSLSAAKKREDVRKVRGLGSIILWQEANPKTQPIIAQELPNAQWDHVGRRQIATRISVKRSLWKVEQAASYRMHDKHPGIRHRAPVVTVALVTSVPTPTLQFLVVNSHFVPHAWCNHKVPHKQWRKDKWRVHEEKFKDIVLDARSKGLTVVGGGDFNTGSGGIDKFHVDQVWFRSARLDYLLGLEAPGGAQFTKDADQSVSLNSDHNALVAELTWTAGGNAAKTGYHWNGG